MPQLVLKNAGTLPVLLLDGEHLEGAMQNRVLNATVLAAPEHETVIPVSCVEQGRWGYRGSAGEPSVGLPGPELAQHPSPVPGCTCGIYASSSLRNLVTSTPSMPAVSAVGTVALWGRVIEHERGWRAEFAYPDRLTLVCVVCLQEGSGAGEPAFVVAEPVASGPYPAVAVCRDHAASVTAEGSRVISPAAVIRSALLDRYAVDLMPFDTVRSLFERDPVPVPFTRPSSPTPVPARQVPTRVAPAGSAATLAAPPPRRQPRRRAHPRQA